MRFDTVVPILATRLDLAELRTEILTAQERLRVDILNAMLEMQRKLLTWIVTTMVAMFLGMVGLFVGISSTMMETTERMVQTHVRGIQDTLVPPPPTSPFP